MLTLKIIAALLLAGICIRLLLIGIFKASEKRSRNWLISHGFPLSIDSVTPAFAEDEYSARSSAIYREAFVNPMFNDDAKDALASLCTSTLKLSYSDKKTAIAIGESLSSLQGLVTLPPPGFGDLGHKFEPPKYRAQMRSICEIVQLHCTFCLKIKDTDQCVSQIGLFSTIIRHLCQMPIPGTYGYGLMYSRALFSQLKTIAKFVTEDATTIQQGLTAAEAIVPFESPWKILPVLFANQLDILSSLPESAGKIHRQILESDSTRKAVSAARRKRKVRQAFRDCLLAYHWHVRLKDPSQFIGISQLDHCDKAEPKWQFMPNELANILRFEYPNPSHLLKQYLTYETLRRMYICAFRVGLSMAEKTDWKLAVQIDGSDIDPYSGGRFLIRTTSRSVKVIADCPDFIGLQNVKDQRLTLRLDVFETLSK